MTNKKTLTFVLMATTIVAANAFATKTKYYDEQGRLERIEYGTLPNDYSGTIDYYDYDSENRVTKITNSQWGVRNSYEYYSDGTYKVTDAGADQTRLYNTRGDVIKAWSNDEWHGVYDSNTGLYLSDEKTYTYDETTGKKLSENSTSYDMGSPHHYNQTWTYDTHGNVTDYTSVSYGEPIDMYMDGSGHYYNGSESRFTYTYDDDGNILTVQNQVKDSNTDWQWRDSAYGWEHAGLPFSSGNVSSVEYTYVDGVLTQTVGTKIETNYTPSGLIINTVGSVTKQYDAQGRVTQEADCHTGYSCNPITYTYDDENHKRTKCYSSGSCYEEAYYGPEGKVYDEYGNVIGSNDGYDYVYANPAWRTASNNTNTQTKTPKRIYTLKEANDAAKPTGNRVSITYK